MIRTARPALRILAVVTVAAGATLIHAAPAHAAPSIPCNQSTANTTEGVANSFEVDPTLTHFGVANVPPGASVAITTLYAKETQVTVSLGGSTEISGGVAWVFANIGSTVGFSVQYTTATTETESTTVSWTFNEAGRYGVYKGTHKVSGTFQTFTCRLKSPDSTRGFWVPSLPYMFPISYTTFDRVELGAIRCGDSAPSGSLRELALRELGC